MLKGDLAVNSIQASAYTSPDYDFCFILGIFWWSGLPDCPPRRTRWAIIVFQWIGNDALGRKPIYLLY